MALQKGDFILIDYIAKVKETNEVFDTTKEDAAKEARIHKEEEIYEPKLVVIGESWVLKALDESLLTAEIGQETTVVIPADKAFGPRDPDKIRRVPIKQLYAKEINPVVGARIEFQGKTATIRAIGAGRVLLDFNPALAGRTLIYDLTVNKKLEVDEEKIGALIHRRVPVVEESKFEITLQDKNLVIDMPEETFYVEGIQIAKRGIAMDIQKFLSNVITTKFVETFTAEPKLEFTPPVIAQTPAATEEVTPADAPVEEVTPADAPVEEVTPADAPVEEVTPEETQ